MWVEPNAFLPWDIYLDWIYEFNDNEDFRDIPIESLICHLDGYLSPHDLPPGNFEGLGDGSEDSTYSYFMFTRGDGEANNFFNLENFYQGCGDGGVNVSPIFQHFPTILGSYGDNGLEAICCVQYLGCGG